jgi:hypothetical protein
MMLNGRLSACFSKSKFFDVLEGTIEEKKIGIKRSKQESPYKVIYQITGVVQERQAAKQQAIKQSSCFVVGTTIPQNEVCDADIICNKQDLI